jgi:glycosyltransferase involved in cell wall biosynthesis/SAM-dependent methyltransferase
MKFSFLIPSKNRLELLGFAVDSIRQQTGSDLEIVISDNASAEDYAGYVKNLGDPRVIYQRAPEPVSVTENWNRALRLATGDYILMLGDDDALAPGYLTRMAELVRKHGQPDIIFCACYHYAYPKVLSPDSKGYLAEVRNSVFFKDRTEPFRLPLEEARRVALAVGDFRYLFGFNSQHFLFRAGFLDSFYPPGKRPEHRGVDSQLSTGTPAAASADPSGTEPVQPGSVPALGSIFQSPYPDTFAAIISFSYAQSILVVPTPMVIIGISPKSFGYYYFNDLQNEGYQFLDNEQVSGDVRDSVKEAFLPGDKNNTHWLVSAETARRALPPEVGLTLNLARYRRLQMVAFLRSIHLKKVRQQEEIAAFVSLLAPPERLEFEKLQADVAEAAEAGADGLSRFFESLDRQLEQFCPAKVTMLEIGPHQNVSDAIRWLVQLPPTCPSCGGAARLRLTATDRNQHTSEEAYRYFLCCECSLNFLEEIPADLGRIYAKEQYDIPPADAAVFQARAETQLWKLEILQSQVAAGSLFEVGPATGEFSHLARQAGFRPRLAEMDEPCCKFLRAVLKLDVIHTADPAATLTSEGSFDAICIWQAIEHIPRFWELMDQAAGHLNPGGVIIVSTPNPGSFQARMLGKYWPHLDAPRHLYLIPQDWFREFARQRGLTVTLDTTRDAGSLGLNYYGWYLAVRNALQRRLSDKQIHAWARRTARFMRRWDETEGKGCSYIMVLRKE